MVIFRNKRFGVVEEGLHHIIKDQIEKAEEKDNNENNEE